MEYSLAIKEETNLLYVQEAGHKITTEPCMVAHTCNPTSGWVEAGGFRVQGQASQISDMLLKENKEVGCGAPFPLVAPSIGRQTSANSRRAWDKK